MAGKNGAAAVKAQNFENEVESAIMQQLKNDQLTNDERNKAIANAIRWSLVKSKIVMPEHGLGFLEEE